MIDPPKRSRGWRRFFSRWDVIPFAIVALLAVTPFFNSLRHKFRDLEQWYVFGDFADRVGELNRTGTGHIDLADAGRFDWKAVCLVAAMDKRAAEENLAAALGQAGVTITDNFLGGILEPVFVTSYGRGYVFGFAPFTLEPLEPVACFDPKHTWIVPSPTVNNIGRYDLRFSPAGI